MQNENIKYIRRFYILGYLFMLIGAVIGGVYYVNRCYSVEHINMHLDNTGVLLKDDINYISITLQALKNNLLIFILIFISIFFRAGGVLVFALIIKEAFVYSFTISAFVAYYGLKGGLLAFAMLPEITLIFPTIMFFSAVNIAYSSKKLKKEKKFFIHYFLFLFLVFAIFCIASVVEGCLTTIFMKSVYSLVT